MKSKLLTSLLGLLFINTHPLTIGDQIEATKLKKYPPLAKIAPGTFVGISRGNGYFSVGIATNFIQFIVSETREIQDIRYMILVEEDQLMPMPASKLGYLDKNL